MAPCQTGQDWDAGFGVRVLGFGSPDAGFGIEDDGHGSWDTCDQARVAKVCAGCLCCVNFATRTDT